MGLCFYYVLRVSASREGHVTPVGKPARGDCAIESVHVNVKRVYVTAFILYGWMFFIFLSSLFSLKQQNGFAH